MSRHALAVSTALVALLAAAEVPARGPASVRHVYRTAPALVGLPTVAFDERYQNAADVILEQGIRNLPLHPGAASAYTYRWNAERDELERVDDAVSPGGVGRRHVLTGLRAVGPRAAREGWLATGRRLSRRAAGAARARR